MVFFPSSFASIFFNQKNLFDPQNDQRPQAPRGGAPRRDLEADEWPSRRRKPEALLASRRGKRPGVVMPEGRKGLYEGVVFEVGLGKSVTVDERPFFMGGVYVN